jgi:hypothetical protein
MDENDLLHILGEAVAAGRVSVALDYKRLKHQDSPICVEADSNRWIYGIMAATLGAGFLVAWTAGAGALAGGLALYFAVGRDWVHRRMAARFHDRTLKDIAQFKRLWRLNGVTLALCSRPALCRSPRGDWRRFVLENLAPGNGREGQ